MFRLAREDSAPGLAIPLLASSHCTGAVDCG
jgi:hypothetical protein